MAHGAASTEHPSILLLLADAWRATAFSAAPRSDVLAETAHLDALRASAVDFAAAYASYPLCTPSRATVLTGRHVDGHGVAWNGMALPPELPTVGRALRRLGGYALSWVGKYHAGGEDCPRRPPCALFPQTSWCVEEVVHRPVKPAQRAGFTQAWAEDCCEAPGHDIYFSPCMVLGNGTVLRGVRRQWEPAFFTDYALGELERLRTAEAARPWLLAVSWRPPHGPFIAPARHVEAVGSRLRSLGGVSTAGIVGGESALVGYFASVRALDEEVGRMVAAADAPPVAARGAPLVVFLSDHGEMLGARGAMGKGVYWDEAARVPLLVRLHGAAAAETPRVWRGAVSLADLAPTLLGLAGVGAAALCGAAATGCNETCADGRDLSAALRSRECVGGTCGRAHAARLVRIGRAENTNAAAHQWLAVASAELKAVRRGAAANASVVVLNTTAGEAEIDAEDAAAREMRHALRAEAGRAAAQAEAAHACARLERSKSAGRQGGHATARTEEI